MLDNIIFSNRKYCFLAGAGISFDSPSNLPLANEIILKTLNSLELNKKIQNEINSQISNSKFRFEQFMEIIFRVYDPNFSILNQLSDCSSPNYIHHFLAKAIDNKHHVFTTNFDNLIEIACDQRDISLKCLYNEKQSIITEFNYLCKLHGTFKDENKVDVRDSIISTLTRVGQKGEAFSNNPFLKDYFNDKFLNYDLIVLGYSGSDDYDILPMIIQSKTKNQIFWIWHINNRDKIVIHNYESFSKKYSDKSKLFKQLISYGTIKDSQLFIIEGNTSTIVSEISKILNYDIMIPQYAEDYKIPNNFYQKWSLLKAIENWRKSRLIGDYYHTIGNYHEASIYYESVLVEVRKVKDYNQIFLILLQLSDTYIRLGNIDRAICVLDFFYELLDKKAENNFHKLAQNRIRINMYELNKYFRHRAICYTEKGKFEKSIELIEKIENEDNTGDQAFTLYELARINNKKGDFEKSIQFSCKAIDIHRKHGNLNSLSICLLFLSSIYAKIKDFENYNKCIVEVKKICKITNNTSVINNLNKMINNAP